MTQQAARGRESSPAIGRTNEKERGASATANRRLGAAPLAAAGNQTVQRLFAEGAIRAKLRVGSPDDSAEHEADQMAKAAMEGGTSCTCSPGGPPCPRCQAAQGMVRRKPRSRDKPTGADNLSLGAARTLGGGDRSFFESRYSTDLSDVRVHDNEETASSAAQLNAVPSVWVRTSLSAAANTARIPPKDDCCSRTNSPTRAGSPAVIRA